MKKQNAVRDSGCDETKWLVGAVARYGRMRGARHVPPIVVCVVLLFAARVGATWGAEPILFNRDVRPILSDRCFACHGPDAGSREAELRLDRRDEATKDRGGYQAVVPGDPDSSELIIRVTSTDESERMPPPDVGKPLTKHQQDLLRQWIRQGAVWQAHWAWTELARPRVPDAAGEPAGNAIDRFIRARLKHAGIKPAPRADRRTLIRRLAFDLTGLPPSPGEVRVFVRDDSPHAYADLVDRLLDSPHYGERMTGYWLDLVRYADSLGYHGDQPRSVSPYRDYVIHAFNANMPFDQFTVENLAGDLLPNATRAQKVASTYNRLNRASAEGGVQPKEYLAKYAADRVRTTASVWLGSTLGCAQCHDHKFDPFTTRDFYSFAAFFADIKEQGIVPGAVHIAQLPVPTAEQTRQLQQLDAQIKQETADLDQRTPRRRQQFAAWLAQLEQQRDRWHLVKPIAAQSSHGATLNVQPDGSILASGSSPDRDTYTIQFVPPLDPIAAVRLDAMVDPSLPQKGPGRAGNGNFVLQRFEVRADGTQVKWKSVLASHSQTDFSAENLARDTHKGWAILPNAGKTAHAVFVPDQELRLPARPASAAPGDARLVITLVQNHGAQHTLGRFRIHVTADATVRAKNATLADMLLPQSIVSILDTPAQDWSPTQRDQLWNLFRDRATTLASARSRLADLKTRRAGVSKSVITTLATAAGPPRITRILPRGNWMDDSGDVVQPAVPKFLGKVARGDRRLTRLDLAHWLVSAENPLTARTFVNRLWMLFFGQGIARTVDDLGSQGQWPTHPALLDWLAVEFMESGWDVKHMVRLIVMSQTYQQSSATRPDLAQRDPLNRLFARQSRWRLDAEFVRDNALAVSGLLVAEIGGPSVKPYQPAGYWAQLNFPKRVYQQDVGDKQYRRGLYTHWQRTYLHPSLLAFDAPPREQCTARRERSNTPLQALVLLNDPTYVEAARVLATRIAQYPAEDVTKKLQWAYGQVLMRPPSAGELTTLGAFFKRNRAFYDQHPADADQLIHVGLKPLPDGLDPVQVAAWTTVARALLNLHETITRY